MLDTKSAYVRNDVLRFLEATFASWKCAHKSMRDAVRKLYRAARRLE